MFLHDPFTIRCRKIKELQKDEFIVRIPREDIVQYIDIS